MGVTPPKKKTKLLSRYLRELEADSRFSGWLSGSKQGDSHAYCRASNRDFRVDHGGMNDITKHTKTAIHQASIKSQKTTPAATNFFMKSKLDQDEDVTRAEVLFANFIAEHNLSFLGYLQDEMNVLLRKFLGKFVRAKVIQSLTSVPFEDDQNQLQDNIIAIGTAARAYLVDNKDDIPISSLRRFFMSVRKFYISITTKMLAKFPFGDPVVCGLSLLNPKNRGDLPPSSITDIARRFPNLVAEEDFTNLEEEFLDYQTIPPSEFPSCDNVRTDEFWGSILHLSNRITQKPRFPLMKKVISAVLMIPNSNADCERVFSIVKKIQTDMRSNLDNSTLCALLTSKLNQKEKCHSFNPTKEQLKCAKSACVSYNNGL